MNERPQRKARELPKLDDVRTELAAVRRYAALSGPFEPVAALRAIGQDLASLGDDKLTLISAGLAQACEPTTEGDGGRERWLMRGSERRRELEAIGEQGTADAVGWRQGQNTEQGETDQQTDDLLDALLGREAFTRDNLTRLAEEGTDQAELARTAEALERAGATAPQHDLLPQLRAALTRLGLKVNRESVLDGFVGRQDELATTSEWAQERADRRTTTLYVQGLPGIGKSTLLDATAAQLVRDDPAWLVVRLDFDRAGLDVQDWQGLTLELARQVAAQVDPVGAELLSQAREQVVATASLDYGLKGDGRQQVHPALGSALGTAVGQHQRRVLVLLDTIEVLRSRGETQPARLFDWLDDVAGYGVPLTIITAGRGDALGAAPDREAKTIRLEGLDDPSADRLLTALGVEKKDLARVRAVARGNPLALRLAAKIAREGGADDLDEVAGESTGQGAFTAAYLYRFLLSRIDDEDLEQLANPGLVVRVIDAEVIREVLAPAVGLDIGEEDAALARATELFESLASQHWLVQPDPMTPGFVRHRADMRAVLLPLLYETQPRVCAKIDRRAAKWFAQRREGWAGIEAAYHRLQLMRVDKRVPAVDPATLGQLDEQTLDELPSVAKDLVLRTRGQRTSGYRDAAPGTGKDTGPEARQLDPEAATELRGIVERGDWVEGGVVYDGVFANAVFDARAPEADTARAYLWRSGRWTEAVRLLRERDDAGADDSDLPELASKYPQEAACRLEMRAELQFDELVAVFRTQQPLRDLAAYLVSQGLRSSLAHGALRLALEMVDGYHAPSPSMLDPAGAAALCWTGTGAQPEKAPGPRIEEVAAWNRVNGRVGGKQPPPSPATQARLLGVLTPFGDLVTAMTATGQRAEVLAFVESAYRGIDRLGLLAPGAASWHDRASSASVAGGLNAMADVGLLAEAIGAAGYVLRDADLNLVAKSAERWRRTMAGCWSYGSAGVGRAGWDRELDASLADRLDALTGSDDPVARSREQLDAWCDPAQGRRSALELVRSRAPGVVQRAARAEGPAEGASLLLGRFVPSAFVPGLCVLIRQDATPHKKQRPRGKES
jgi:hypothetical protein